MEGGTNIGAHTNTATVELCFSGTAQNFRSGVTQTIPPAQLIDTEYGSSYAEKADLSHTQIHSIRMANLSGGHLTDSMSITVVPATGSTAANAHLNKLNVGTSTMRVLSTIRPMQAASNEIVYEQPKNFARTQVQMFPVDKLSSQEHTSIIPEPDGSKSILLMSDECIRVLTEGLNAIHKEERGCAPDTPFDFWELRKRFDRPELKQADYDTLIDKMKALNAKSRPLCSDLSQGMGVQCRWVDPNAKMFDGNKNIQIRFEVCHTPVHK